MTHAGLMAVLLVSAGPLQSELIGDWARRDGGTRIRIAPCDGALCATNVWVRDPDGDEKVGDVLKMVLDQTAPSSLSGSARDERRDMTLSMSITLNGSQMRTSGCVMLGIICKSAEWTRTN